MTRKYTKGLTHGLPGVREQQDGNLDKRDRTLIMPQVDRRRASGSIAVVNAHERRGSHEAGMAVLAWMRGVMAAGFAHRSFHSWAINEHHSNASATIQFVEFRESAGPIGSLVLLFPRRPRGKR